MAIFQTERNRVYAYDPQPDDVFVRASLLGPADGEDIFNPRRLTSRHLRYMPITSYLGLVEWAIGMADKMAYPIHILPLSYRDMMVPGRFKPICEAVASMTDQEHGEMRRIVVTTCAEVMRDCPDQQVRADAYEVLQKLKGMLP
jgi:hypothetical protein